MKDEFSINLSSTNSIRYFPENTPSNFTVRLPYKIQLQGDWQVALTEIHYPQTCMHVTGNQDSNWLEISTTSKTLHKQSEFSNSLRPYSLGSTDRVYDSSYEEVENHYTCRETITTGVFSDLREFVAAVNSLAYFKNHLEIEIVHGNFIKINKKCSSDETHFLTMSQGIAHIMGIVNHDKIEINNTSPYTSTYPASLIRALPDSLYVYMNLCVASITGDTQTPLLRRVSFERETYCFGAAKTKEFSWLKYLSLQYNEFETIEIDIRDRHGKKVPFSFGALDVTLHFKRVQ